MAAPIGTMVFAVPLTRELVTIDGPDGIRYVARWERHLEAVIHDPMTFAVEGKKLYIQQEKKVWTLRLVSRIRIPE